jgi:hypothetical protein
MSLSEDDFEIKSKIYSFKKLVWPVLIDLIQDNIVPFYIFLKLSVGRGFGTKLIFEIWLHFREIKKNTFSLKRVPVDHTIVLSSTHPFPSCMYNTPLSEGIFAEWKSASDVVQNTCLKHI